jgi:hypothetical protein
VANGESKIPQAGQSIDLTIRSECCVLPAVRAHTGHFAEFM